MQPESRFVESDGVNHHYLEWGSPGNPRVVMFHAVGMHSQIWNNAARDLARDYHVHSFDLRGHGDTQPPEGSYTFQQIGEDVASVIETLGLEGSIGIGHSAGGMSSHSPALSLTSKPRLLRLWPAGDHFFSH